ncbi:hypothetical protein EYE35_11405 [Cereibacter sphaeroides]|nr:hypothetical protein EYE35_11405 [Cereibacter sphaeroides]
MPPAAGDGSGVGHGILSQRPPARPTGFRPGVCPSVAAAATPMGRKSTKPSREMQKLAGPRADRGSGLDTSFSSCGTARQG